MTIVNKDKIIEQFLKKFSVLNDSGYDDYELYFDMGMYRIEIKHRDKMLYFLEYNKENKTYSSNEVMDSKMYKLLKKLLIDYYDLKGIK